MKERIRNYVNELFAEVYDTQQLRELKEEMSANLLEKANDLLARGLDEEAAFKKAVASLGDVSELIASLKKAAVKKCNDNRDTYRTFPLSQKQVAGYAIAAVIFLLGIMAGGTVYLRQKDLLTALKLFTPFLLVSAPLFTYFGLIQETRQHYGMQPKRALSYSLAGAALLLGLAVSGLLYLQGRELFLVFATLMPFVILSGVAFMYLGLTEKKRRKMGPGWENEWLAYYSNPQAAILMGGISGALWFFAIAACFIVAFTLGWKYSWIVLIIAVGLQAFIAAVFAPRKKE